MWRNRTSETYGLKDKSYLPMVYTILLLFLSGSFAWGGLPNDKMDYHDYNETVAVLQGLRDAHPDLVTLKIIGHSYDIPEQGQASSYDIYAMRVGPVGEQGLQDGGTSCPPFCL